MIKIAICDDEHAEVQYLSALAQEWAMARGVAISISTYVTAENFIVSTKDEPDILLLDIQMGAMDGMALARHIRRANGEMQIIFITGYTDYLAEGYEVDALYYLLKPVEPEKLFAALDKAAGRLQKDDSFILVQAGDETLRMRPHDIRYIESFAHYVQINTADDCIKTRAKVSGMEAALGDGFVRCHRCYLVGIRHISRITKSEVIMEGGQVIPLSRRLYKEVNRAFIDYHTSGG